jgi:hypothetical protein
MKMSKKLFCLIYFSGVFSKCDLKSSVFTRLTWIFERNHNILKLDILGKLFERQGYCKDFKLFSKVTLLINVNPFIFKANLKNNGINPTESLIRLNYYILLHLRGVYNNQTKFYNIKYIEFNYEKNKRVKNFASKIENVKTKEAVGDFSVAKNEIIDSNKIEIGTQTHIINNTNNLLLYKENVNKKYNNESRKILNDKDKKKIIMHKVHKLTKVFNYLKFKTKIVTNPIKLRKLTKTIKKISEQIQNEIALSKMLGLKISKKDFKRRYKPNSFAIKPIVKPIKTTSSAHTVTRDSLNKAINTQDENQLFSIRNIYKKKMKRTKSVSGDIIIYHNNFTLDITAEYYDSKVLNSFSERVKGLIKDYKKNKKLAKNVKLYSYILDKYIEMFKKSNHSNKIGIKE